jgi:hypothetical protein
MFVTEEILKEMETHHPEQAQAWANGYSYGVDTWDYLNPYEWGSPEFDLFTEGYEQGDWWFQGVHGKPW